MRRFVQSLEPITHSLSQLNSGRKDSNDTSESFVPFHNERDSLGRLLSKPKKECTNEVLNMPKIKNTKANVLLVQLLQDAKLSAVSTPPVIDNRLNLAFEQGGWKTRKFIPKIKGADEEITPRQNQKISQSTLNTIIIQKDKQYSKVIWPSMNNLDSEKSTLVGTPKTQTSHIANVSKPVKSVEVRKSNKSVFRDQSLPKLSTSFRNDLKGDRKILQDQEPERNNRRDYSNTKTGRPSVQKILNGMSHFKNLKTEENQMKFLEDQNVFQSKVTEMKGRLSNLKKSIGDVYTSSKPHLIST